jgi:hypothetical protein
LDEEIDAVGLEALLGERMVTSWWRWGRKSS